MDLIERLRSSAKAFRENTVYDSEGDPLRLIVQAEECEEAAATIASLRERVAELGVVANRALYRCMKFPIARYLIANTHGRLDGAEKATRHLELSTIACHALVGNAFDDSEPDFDLVMRIHDASQALTSYMDTQIGFPIYDRPDYDALGPLFFARFMELARAALQPKDTNHDQ